jgi:hypothetical protein
MDAVHDEVIAVDDHGEEMLRTERELGDGAPTVRERDGNERYWRLKLESRHRSRCSGDRVKVIARSRAGSAEIRQLLWRRRRISEDAHQVLANDERERAALRPMLGKHRYPDT